MPNRMIGLMCGLAWIGFTGMAFAGDFEGVIHMKSSFKDEETRTLESDWFVKGDNIRLETRLASAADRTSTSRMGAMIFNADKKTHYILMPERKVYMEQSAEGELEKATEHFKDRKYEIVRTGKTDKIAGYTCEIFLTKDKETGKIRGESCAAKGLANMGGVMGLSRSDAGKLSGDIPRELRQIIKEGFFTLRMVTLDEDGLEQMRMEAMKVDKKRLESSLFVPPPDYLKFDMGALMQQRTKAMQEGKKEGRSQVDLQQMMQEMQKRQAERSGGSGSQDPGGQQGNMQDLMKNLGEMMKKQQGGQ